MALSAVLILLNASIPALAQTNAYFVFGDPVRPDTFVIQLTNPQEIQTARVQGAPWGVNGTVVARSALYNPPWTFYLDPNTINIPTVPSGCLVDLSVPIVFVQQSINQTGSTGLFDNLWCPQVATFRELSVPAAPLHFVPITPCRVADTRGPIGPLGGPYLPAGQSRDFPVTASNCGIPSNAQAYALNVTVVPRGSLSYLTVWPAGQPQPAVSTLNSYDARTKANMAIVGAGTSGALSVHTAGPTDVVLDISGYFMSATLTGGLPFYPIPPCRC